VLQISGKELFNETRELANSALADKDENVRRRYRLEPYLNEEMATALQAADLVLCRAGATTLSELAVLGKPSILVPLPPAIGSSPQEANADMFRRKEAAQVILDAELKPEILVERVRNTITSFSSLKAMSKAASALARPNATQDIAATIIQIAKVKKV
jgi:UDP-N-acetylglucosamine--N-acetylmuramyl-(pentapeptide) pyrophosphoryl-undecaprenol N-acetylglucosamine transferase